MSSSEEEDFSDDDLSMFLAKAKMKTILWVLILPCQMTFTGKLMTMERRLVDFTMTILARYFATRMLVQQSMNYLVRSDLWIFSSSL